jgi:hypothetical protein
VRRGKDTAGRRRDKRDISVAEVLAQHAIRLVEDYEGGDFPGIETGNQIDCRDMASTNFISNEWKCDDYRPGVHSFPSSPLPTATFDTGSCLQTASIKQSST